MANKIIISGKDDFNLCQTFECGQIFLYEKISDDEFCVVSSGHRAKIKETSDGFVIETDKVDYFENYFDLQTNYCDIKKKLKEIGLPNEIVDFGYGIRILNQNPVETIIGFVVSQNNNIPRIKKILKRLCLDFGEECGESFSFPTIAKLNLLSSDYFKQIGAGYRSEYLVSVIKAVANSGIEYISGLNSIELDKYLLSIKGIGRKVADCILLFAFARKDVFPVDVWIEKAYNSLNKTNETNRLKIRDKFVEAYKNLSGYAQQYIYYYFIKNKI